MIKRISHIKKAGVFKNYRRSGNIQDFKKLNIIYGWNYSGKTTLSRLFHCLEKKKNIGSLRDSEFEFIDYDDKKIKESSVSSFGGEIRVFNTDFIKNNLSWEGEAFNPILLLGEESIEAKKEIEEKKIRVERVQEIQSTIKNVYENLEKKIEDGLTNTAKDITNKLGLVEQFTKTHLRPIFIDIKNDFISCKLEKTVREKLMAEAKISDDDKLANLDKFSATISSSELIEEAKELLTEVPEMAQTIDYLRKNQNVANWIETGLELHKEKEICEFCGNSISNERKKELLAHFSEDLRIHKEKIYRLLTRIEESKITTPQLRKTDFYKQFQKEFERQNNSLKGIIKKYNQLLNELAKTVKKKKENSFESLELPDTIEDLSDELSVAIENYNEVITSNNSYTDQFAEKKASAIQKLKKHYTACFIEEIKLPKVETKISLYKARERMLEDLQRSINREIIELEAKISNAQLGRKELNTSIERFLGRDEIKVEVVKYEDQERFILKRNDEKALNLSEGEKTAIAFSFFLTKLREIDDFEKAIVFIDDPISSLDSNHIFQVNAIIKDFFFLKKDENSSWQLTCDQLFISTHNFDFFSLLRELPKKGSPQNHLELQHSYYYVRRINEEEAIIDKLPKAIEKYTSEYHYLFKEIYDFHHSDNKSDYGVLMNIPNAVRRFVELYTYSRLPGNRSSTVDQRANKLWGQERSKRILKVFHYFSHSNNIERILKNSDLLCDIEGAVDDLMTELQQDKDHFDELVKSVGN